MRLLNKNLQVKRETVDLAERGILLKVCAASRSLLVLHNFLMRFSALSLALKVWEEFVERGSALQLALNVGDEFGVLLRRQLICALSSFLLFGRT